MNDIGMLGFGWLPILCTSVSIGTVESKMDGRDVLGYWAIMDFFPFLLSIMFFFFFFILLHHCEVRRIKNYVIHRNLFFSCNRLHKRSLVQVLKILNQIIIFGTLNDFLDGYQK
jgi:hypothetical protein